MKKDAVLTAIAVVILLLTATINWTIQSWLAFAALVVVLIAWYVKK